MDSFIYKIKKYLAPARFVVLAGSMVYAETVTIKQPDVLKGNYTPEGVISGLISLIIIISFLAAFFYLLFGGFKWITSGGDEANVGAARQMITQALIGLIIVVAVWALFQLVEQFLGVTIFGEGGFTIPVIGGSSSASNCRCVGGTYQGTDCGPRGGASC